MSIGYPEDCGCPECQCEAIENDAAGQAILRSGRFPVGRRDTLTTRHMFGPFRSTIDYLAEQHLRVINTTKPATDREWREHRLSQTLSAAEFRRWARN